MKNMIKTGLVFFVLSLVFLFPSVLAAQSGTGTEGYDYDGKAITAILPFTGEEEPAAVFNQAVVDAVDNMEQYSSRIVTMATVEAAGGRVPTDMPPIRELVPGVRFAITGGVYPGTLPNEYYLQLWLWDMVTTSMIYSDDLVYEHMENGLEALPGLVEWLFSHIVVVSTEIEPPAEPVWTEKQITVGVRSGVSQRWYTDPGEAATGAQALNFEGGIFVSVFLNSLFSVQAEINFTFDNLVYRGINNVGGDGPYSPQLVNRKYTVSSLVVPLIAKATFRPGNFRLAPFAGIYVFAPLGNAAFQENPGGKEDSFSWSATAPLGYTVGFEIARKLGPGILSGDIRYADDFTNTSIQDAGTISYKRRALTFTLGYGFGFDMRKR
jgi:hypothetical protein